MKNAALLLVLALACALTACNNATADRSVNNSNVIDEYENNTVDRSALPDGDYTAEAVIGAVSDAGGLTQLPLEVANSVLDNYIMRLGDVSAAANLVPDLKLVRSEINSGIIDRGEVGRALLRMGAETRLIAAEDSPYRLLGSALTTTGEELVGEDPEPDRDRG